MKKCPFCEAELQIVNVDAEGFDVLGCDNCLYEEGISEEFDKDILFFI